MERITHSPDQTAIPWRTESPGRQRPTANYIRAIVFAATDGEIVELLVEAALDAIEQRDAIRAVLLRALALLREQDERIDRQDALIVDLRARGEQDDQEVA